MYLLLIILVILILCGGGIGYHSWGTPYGYSGISVGTILLIALIVLLLRGSL